MNRRQKIIVSVTGIFIVLLALLGLTYAYFLTQISGNEETKSISVTTANLLLEYKDGNGIIIMNNIMPGDPIPTKTFTVTNRGNETAEGYKVYLENVQNQLELKDDLTYTLICKSFTKADYETWEELEDESIDDLTEQGTCSGTGSTTFPSVMSVIATNSIDVGYTHYYELIVEYPNQGYDQSIDMNKLVQAKVNIYDGRTKFLATEIMSNVIANKENSSTTGTLYMMSNELPTKIAEEPSRENEKILSYTMDDLGTSYYYRGNVEDNYVNFANMCWRIVRINGDGSTKLILEDQYTTCNDNETINTPEVYTGNWRIGTGNYGYKKNTTKNIISYRKPEMDIEKSMVKAFYDIQTTKLTDYTSKLKVEDWCIGDKAYTRSISLPYTYNDLEQYDYSQSMYYDAYTRLRSNNANGYQPTLKCNGTTIAEYVDIIGSISKLPMYVSTLTADEIVFAGGTVNSSNNNFYLINEQNSVFWLLSPYCFYNNNDYSFLLNKDGTLNYGNVDGYSGFRPSVTLVSNALINLESNEQPGTINNLYVIN